VQAVAAVGVELPGLDRSLHGAAGLAAVLAVAVAAVGGQLCDIGEHGLEADLGLEQAERPHPRCIDDQRAAGEGEQLAARGAVSSAIVLVGLRDGLLIGA
jgi:hypothetical protein